MDQAELTKQPADVTECPFKLDKSFSHKVSTQDINNTKDIYICIFRFNIIFSCHYNSLIINIQEESKGAQFFFDPKSLDGNPIGARKRKGERQERESKSKKQGEYI